ncbi:MAG: DegT/DnrJ/EryC1/StrS family aminotransferase [Kiritimatiellae bacterium]|nr:DegT/DnrJ/EryC1/StrS family aminotransferase [Kiritimatiellia bacterium]
MQYGPFARKLRTYGKTELKNLKEVLNRGRLSIFYNDGGMVDRFQKAFAKYTGAKIALARVNGMGALAEAISVSGAGVGTEVLCDPVVHFGALAALYYNAVPRFVDIEPDTYCMDPKSLEANITPRARAVIVTHLWGLPARIDEIRRICKKHKLFLIEDCAHAVGARWKDKHVGTFGNLGMFSFQEFKQLSTGDGAMVTIQDKKLADNMENVWAFSGESPRIMTLNWRMNEMTAAIGLAQLGKVDSILRNTYNVTLKIFNDAIAGCRWLKPRLVPKEAIQTGYWFACKWEGDKFGLNYSRFKQLNEKLDIGLRFGFNQTAPYEFDFFHKAQAYGHQCPNKCPFYLKNSRYVYRKGLCPVVEDVMPRLVTVNLIFLSIAEAKRMAEKLGKAINMMDRG